MIGVIGSAYGNEAMDNNTESDTENDTERKEAKMEKLENLSTVEAVTYYLTDAGYSEDEIKEGLEYASTQAHDWSDWDEVAELAISRILYTDKQLEDGEYAEGLPGHVKQHLKWMNDAAWDIDVD